MKTTKAFFGAVSVVVVLMAVAGFALPAAADYCYGACNNYPYNSGSYNYPYNYPYNSGNPYSYQYPQQNNYPPSCTITLSQSNSGYSQSWISTYGYPMLLTWSSTNATSASISPDIGSVSTSGSRIVYQKYGQVYSMSVYGSGGTAVCQTSSYSPTYPYNYSYDYSYPYNYQNNYSYNTYPYQSYTTYPYQTYTYPTQSYQVSAIALSQVPYTGADFGFVGTLIVWLSLILLAGISAVVLMRRTQLLEKAMRITR